MSGAINVGPRYLSTGSPKRSTHHRQPGHRRYSYENFIKKLPLNKGVPVKAVLSMTPCFFFLYVNFVVLVTLRSKAIFRETSRYILLTNMLFVDTLQLLLCMLMYIFAVGKLYLSGFVCLVVLVSLSIGTRISPINLAVMSLERYVAICFPLRHAEIATSRRTGVAIGVIWVLGSLNSLTDILVFVITGSTFASTSGFCSRSLVFHLEVYEVINKTYSAVYFLSVGVIIIYTYIGIMAAARSAASDKMSAAKARKTVLLHLIQLGLYLASFLYDSISLVAYAHLDRMSALNIQYVMFLGLVIFPRCLSPLIYGLRDQMFRPILLYFLCSLPVFP
ncbi:odorant receptor 131-2-like [Megalops cyprinoides]|uniref:odorant receptor 131-2-like n=1 Tax=Megalops cyprinoides TaxID=118141 RepID=UPI0018645022|nr:odorant receptor 131-2-like [Megalops cyprinoides]